MTSKSPTLTSLQVTASPLAALGVGTAADEVYRLLLRAGPLDSVDLAARTGSNPDEVAEAVALLTRLRLVRRAGGGGVIAAHPRAALARLVQRETERLDLRRRDLEDARDAVADYVAEHGPGPQEPVDAATLVVVPPEQVAATVAELISTTTGPIRSMHLEVAAGPAVDPGVEDFTHDLLRAGRELRSIYPASVIERPEGVAWVREYDALGERQRVVPRIPAEFAVFGDEAVLAGRSWGEAVSGAVLARLPVIVALFRTVFDDAWASGQLVPDEQSFHDLDTRLLAMLASGFKDEAIARHLGIGLRTMRRRVAGMMDDLGAQTRFQLAVAAERRGLLGTRTEAPDPRDRRR